MTKAQKNKAKDPRYSEKYAFEKAYDMWDGKNFLTGEFVPRDRVKFSNMAHVLAKGRYEWFRYYSRNVVILSIEQHTLFDNMTSDGLNKRLREHPEENWNKLIQYEYELLAEYDDWETEHDKEYKY